MKSTPDYTGIGPEFDHLKNMREILLNEDLARFVKKACSLLQSGRGLEQRDCYKRSLLHYAAMGNCTNLLLYILQTERNIESRDMWGRTPLSWAAQYGSLAVTEILLEKGANVNARDYEGGTPWTWLIHAGDSTSKSLPATEAYLRERGAKEV
jgi:ankyrin repeat protein